MAGYRSFEEKAVKIIQQNNYMTIATSSKKGGIWAAVVSYVYDKNYNFYFLSAIDSRHAENIIENPEIALEIFDSKQKIGSAEGVQAEGDARFVPDGELESAIKLYAKRFFNDSETRAIERYPPEDYGEAAEFRFFKIKVSMLFATDGGVPGEESYMPSNERRVEIDLKKLSKK